MCKKNRKWSGSALMYLPRPMMGIWEAKMKTKPILFSNSSASHEKKFSSISEIIQQYNSQNDYFHPLQEWVQRGDQKEIQKGLEESLMQASQGNLMPLYALLQLIPKETLLTFIFEHFPNSDTVNHLFIQLLNERITDQLIPEIIFRSPLAEPQKREFFKLYLDKSYPLDRKTIDQEGNNILHYFCRYLTDPFKGRQVLALKCATLENFQEKNKNGETPGMLATGSLATFFKTMEATPDDYF